MDSDDDDDDDDDEDKNAGLVKQAAADCGWWKADAAVRRTVAMDRKRIPGGEQFIIIIYLMLIR